MEFVPRDAQGMQTSAVNFNEEESTAFGNFRAMRHFLPTWARFSSRLYLRTGSQILSIGSADLVNGRSITAGSRANCLSGAGFWSWSLP